MKALSIRQPWAWLILHGGKDIENRVWPTRFRGKFLIHAAKGMTIAEWEEARDFVWHVAGESIALEIPTPKLLERGGIVGEAEIVGCISCAPRPPGGSWFTGPYGFVLRNVKPLPFRPCKGALGFFEPKFEEVA